MPATLDLDTFFSLPRLTNIHVSPDGRRLALTVQTAAAGGKRFVGAVWEVDTSGSSPARRLTRSQRGETARGYLPDGSLLFTSARDDADAAPGGAPEPAEALHVLPAGGGEARRLVAPPAGVGEVLLARASGTVVVTAGMHPGAVTWEDDAERDRRRRDAGVSARLTAEYPERYWDHDLGPRQPRLFAADVEGGDGETEVRDLTPTPPWNGWLEDMSFALSDDGSRVAFGVCPRPGSNYKADLAVLDTSGSGGLRILVEGEETHGALAWSPDGSTLAVAAYELGAPDRPMRYHLRLVDVATGSGRDLVADWAGNTHEITWLRDGSGLLVVAEDRGDVAVFRVGLDGDARRMTPAGCSFSGVTLTPDGATLYAIASHVDTPPHLVALDLAASNWRPRRIEVTALPAVATGTRREEVRARSGDGTEVHSWLVLPDEGGGPFPLAVLIHGGPFSSWSAWTWRWCAALFAARGWAVLLPNPRLSTGYGQHHISSAWGDWATLPAADIHAAIDATLARHDVDESRVAALGGSYGGYMANWLAVTTDRFAAIVTHASVWNLLVERDVSDVGCTLDREFGDPATNPEVWLRQSPHSRAGHLGTPMLVIHGERDQRVGLSNSQALFTTLQLAGVPSRLLVYPDENHWVLRPGNSRLWYQTVFAFLGEQVLGEEWVQPDLV